jgi:molecular chaperone DnaJ
MVFYHYNRPCKGRGVISSSVKENINIPKGVDSGVNLRISKKGNVSPTGTPGDLMI